MKRFFALFLLILLPVQISWALAGSYCAHEQSSTAGHFGHHAHVHNAAPDESGSKSPLQSHPDCSSCHHVTFSILDDGGQADPTSMQRAVMWQVVSPLPSHPPGVPERPNWVPAV